MTQQITLYTSRISPLGHRVELALVEAGAKFTRFELNLRNKPEWYVLQVNPTGKIPVIAYGGPDVPPDQPSPESIKLPESIVLLEFIADLFPESGLLPADPVLRAKARLFIDAFTNIIHPAHFKVYSNGGDPEGLLIPLEKIQALLPAEGFAIGEFSIADVAIAPHLARLELSLKNDLGSWPAGQGWGPKMFDLIHQPKFARINAYSKAIQSRPSFVATWNPELVMEINQLKFKELREKQFGA